MKADTASRTAQYMALYRAIETVRRPGRRLFKDPYAITFLNKPLKMVTRLSALPVVNRYVLRIIGQRIPGALTSGVARTKYIDDLLQQAVSRGVQQVVILGAGFDTRALRLDFLRSVPVIEIDHPDTARWKMDKIKERLGKLPENVRYYQIDFNQQSLPELAVQHQINFSVPTAFIWEGVTNYLTADAVAATFKFMGSFAKGSQVIFTYVDRLVLDSPQSFFGAEKLLQDLIQIEERWTFGFRPGELAAYLQTFQLTLLEDQDAVAYRARYLPDRPEKGYEFYRVALAEKR